LSEGLKPVICYFFWGSEVFRITVLVANVYRKSLKSKKNIKFFKGIENQLKIDVQQPTRGPLAVTEFEPCTLLLLVPEPQTTVII
jgi:hypothetical protein